MLLTGGLWIAFVVYWSAAARNAAARTLVTSFGAEYEQYRRNTWPLLPGLF